MMEGKEELRGRSRWERYWWGQHQRLPAPATEAAHDPQTFQFSITSPVHPYTFFHP